MNLSNITQGMTIKNYKELCMILDEKQKAGKSKQLQLENWKCYFDYSKDGHRFIIHEIYTEPKTKINNRGGSRLLPRVIRMERVFMYLLNLEETKGEMFLTFTSLLKQMNLINQNYVTGRQHIKKVSKYLNIEEAIVQEFFDYSSHNFKYNIESMLDRLKSRSMLFWSKVITVCVANVHMEKNALGEIVAHKKKVIDEFDNEEILLYANEDTDKEWREATKEEIELILHVEGKVMDKLKCISKQDVIVQGLWKEFIEEVNETLFRKANILYYYTSYRIIRNEERISREVENNLENWIKDEIEFTVESILLNNDAQEQILTNTERRQLTALKNLSEEGYISYKIQHRLSDEFLNSSAKIIDNFLKSGTKDIRNKIKYTKIK